MTNGVISVDQFYVPEGSVMVYRCGQCGGRAEYLADYAAMTSVSIELAVATSLNCQLDAFLATHAQCATVPLRHDLDADVIATSRKLIAEAAQAIREGGDFDEAAYVLTNQGVVVAMFPECASPLTTDDEYNCMRVAVAKLHWDLRDFVRTHGLEVRGVVHVSEGWVSSDPQVGTGDVSPRTAPDSRKALVVTVLTPTSGHVVFAPISRDTADDRGPGLVGAGEWRILQQSAPPVDGMLAVRIPPTADEHPVVSHPELPNSWTGTQTRPGSFIH